MTTFNYRSPSHLLDRESTQHIPFTDVSDEGLKPATQATVIGGVLLVAVIALLILMASVA